MPYGFATLLSDLPDDAKAMVFETLVDDFFGPSEMPESAIVFDRQQHLQTAREPKAPCPPGQAMAQWIMRNKTQPRQVFLVDGDDYAKKYQRLQDAAARTERLTLFPSEIVDDGLYLGPLETATSSAVLNGLAITHVLSVIDHSVPLPSDARVEHLSLCIEDHPAADFPEIPQSRNKKNPNPKPKGPKHQTKASNPKSWEGPSPRCRSLPDAQEGSSLDAGGFCRDPRCQGARALCARSIALGQRRDCLVDVCHLVEQREVLVRIFDASWGHENSYKVPQVNLQFV